MHDDVAGDRIAQPEVVRRRYSRVLNDGIRRPSLVVVDGGKGQLSSARRELESLGLGDLPIIGLAKEREEIFRPGDPNPLVIDHSSGAIRLLQRIRDEAHRFAITGHRRRRAKRHSQSILETIPGLGPVKRRELLKQFGGMQGILRAGVDDFVQIRGLGRELAEAIYEHLHPGK